MSISLFPHNQMAYDSLLPLLETERKACIIHPTGTGKSFIGFKLCEDHPDKTVCWLSPSEYIFQTQLENLRQASNGYLPENICFFTYAKLMLMDEAAISEIRPDYIILDEFHRCGAELWGKGVQDPSTSKAFANFKVDESEHLKLLFCIDMLNEGIHVDGVSGVILLRPTISPIIYKQQIGRALAAGAKKDAVIIDVVLNIENLYSIGTIQEEMQAAITYYRYLGESPDALSTKTFQTTIYSGIADSTPIYIA